MCPCTCRRPGGPVFEVATMVKQGLNAEREVIFVDQRGTHRAIPRLGCPGWEQFMYDAVGLPFAADSTTAADAAAMKACRDQLAATGADLAAYDSTAECRGHRRVPGGAGHRQLERLRGLVRIQSGVDPVAQSPAGHSQRGPRFGVAPCEQYRRDLVVGPGQFVQGDLRRLRSPVRMRRRLPEPGSGLHGHGEPSDPGARRHAGRFLDTRCGPSIRPAPHERC